MCMGILTTRLPSWVFIVTVIVALIFIGLLYWQANLILKDIYQISSGIGELSNGEKEELEAIDPVEQLTNCSQLRNPFDVIECFMKVFKEGGNSEKLCREIKKEVNMCYMGAAFAKGNKAICENLSSGGEKGVCQTFATLLETDTTREEQIATCNSIDQASAVLFCYNLIFKERKYSEALCGEINEEYKWICYMGAAMAKKNENLCNMIEGEKEIEAGTLAKNTCYIRVAIAKKDGAVCEKIEAENRDECYATTADEIADITLCEEIQQEFNRSDCYMKLIEGTEDPELCSKILEGQWRDVCFTEIAKNKKDEGPCEKVAKKDSCYLDIAIETEDESICENAGQLKDACYGYIASQKKDELLCEKITGGDSVRGICYLNVAWAKKDLTLCEKVKTEKIRERCRDDFNK